MTLCKTAVLMLNVLSNPNQQDFLHKQLENLELINGTTYVDVVSRIRLCWFAYTRF